MTRAALNAPQPPEEDDLPGFRPLYRQVREKLIRRLVDGVWQPGQALPSEMQLAADLGVSQGTVRKALDAMAAENMVVRRQGRGTFVASHDEERILFQFFKLVPDDGVRCFPQSMVMAMAAGEADATEAAILNIELGDPVIRIRRLRSLGSKPVVIERLILPQALFPGLADTELPNNLYGLYAMRYGITVSSTRERLKAVTAEPEDALTLEMPPDTPVLRIDRVAFSLDNVPVEWRISVCLTQEIHYHSDLR